VKIIYRKFNPIPPKSGLLTAGKEEDLNPEYDLFSVDGVHEEPLLFTDNPEIIRNLEKAVSKDPADIYNSDKKTQAIRVE